MSAMPSFKSIENKHDVYRSKDWMEKYSESLREQEMEIINLKKKKNEVINGKICYICQQTFENKYVKDKKYYKVSDHCHYTENYRGAAHSICNLKYSAPKKTAVAFHKGSNYDYDFFIKKLGEEFKNQFTCFRENTEKYITYTVPTGKEVTRIDKNGEKVKRSISYILQFIDRARFLARSLSNLANNLYKEIHKIKCKYGHDDKKCETFGITYEVRDYFLEYTNFKDDLLECKCLCCNKNYQQQFDENLKERFLNTYKLSKYNKHNFILLLQNIVHPYEYLNDWEVSMKIK